MFGRIDVFSDPALALDAWGELEETCAGSIYQTRRFLLPWIEAFAGPLSITPMLVTARNAAGAPMAFLPLGVRRRGRFGVAQFLGDKDSNANMGLFTPGLEFSRADLVSLLRAAAAKSIVRPDLYLLTNQPETWEGRPNPLDIFPHQESASFLHSAALTDSPAAFFSSRLSKDAAKKLRQKRKKLEAMGPVVQEAAQSGEAARAIIAAFLEQKLARFRDKNISSIFESPEARSFLEAASAPAPAPALEWHALRVNERIVATYGGGSHRGRLHLMVNSFDTDPEIARCSPGDLLLQSILEQKCAEGLDHFDLGIGEARYKDSWCDQAAPMFDSIPPVTGAGFMHALFERGRLNAKRWIKRSDWAMPMVKKVWKGR